MKEKLLPLLLLILSLSGCYEGYTGDYKHTACYFASQRPLRTVIADRDMGISVGVAIGGRREASADDWATFALDETLLEGTSLQLLPPTYYTLSDASRMTVSKRNLPIASIDIRFTEAFYEDPLTAGLHYALPFRLTGSSLDGILEGKETSVVAVKYISTYHGTYYVKGLMTGTDGVGNTVVSETYIRPDLSSNITRPLVTLSRNELYREGLGSLSTGVPSERVQFSFRSGGVLSVETAPGGYAISDGAGSWKEVDGTLELTASYKFVRGGINYSVTETLTRRQDPLKDLVYEEW